MVLGARGTVPSLGLLLPNLNPARPPPSTLSPGATLPVAPQARHNALAPRDTQDAFFVRRA